MSYFLISQTFKPNLDFLLIRGPYFKKMNGTGIKLAANKPKSKPAQPVPMPRNMYPANSGNAAPNDDLKKVLAATAEAATSKYDSIM